MNTQSILKDEEYETKPDLIFTHKLKIKANIFDLFNIVYSNQPIMIAGKSY